MHVTRSIVYGVVDPCKTESSQKAVPVHPLIVETLAKWRAERPYRKPDDLRNSWILLLHPYRTDDLCPDDRCPL